LTQKEEEMGQLVERLQRLEVAQERQHRGRRWEQRRASRSHMHYEIQEEEQDWRVHNFEERHHQQPPSKPSFPFIKLPSFSGESDPDVYLGWKSKVEQIFNVYEVQKDLKIKLASLEFVDCVMQWWHQTVMDIGLNKRLVVVSWDDLKDCMHLRFVPPHYKKELLLKLQRLQQGPRSVETIIMSIFEIGKPIFPKKSAHIILEYLGFISLNHS